MSVKLPQIGDIVLVDLSMNSLNAGFENQGPFITRPAIVIDVEPQGTPPATLRLQLFTEGSELTGTPLVHYREGSTPLHGHWHHRPDPAPAL